MPKKSGPADEQKLSPLNLRTTAERRKKLEARAKAHGKSLAQEIEALIDAALEMEEQLGGPDLVDAVKLIARTAAVVQQETAKGISDPLTRARVTAAIHAAADWAIPLCALRLKDEPQALGVIEIYTVLCMSGVDIDISALWRLAEGVPLSKGQFEELRDRLSLIGDRVPAFHEWSKLTHQLEDLQAAAQKMRDELADDAKARARRPRAAFNYALLEYKRKMTQASWEWQRAQEPEIRWGPVEKTPKGRGK